VILTSDYRSILATFQSELKYSREPEMSRYSGRYHFIVGPIEYKVWITAIGEGIYSVMFRPKQVIGTPEEQIKIYEKVTGVTVDVKDIDWRVDEWLESGESLKTLGTGSAFKVISNVISIIDGFVQHMESGGKPVRCLQFQALKEEESRVRVYNKIVNSYKSKGFTVQQAPYGNYMEYYVCRDGEL
jgi:hypothetical protein